MNLLSPIMLQPVWPSLPFWFGTFLYSSLAWLVAAVRTEFYQKTTGPLGVFLGLALFSTWFIGLFVPASLFTVLFGKNEPDIHLFHGYERIGKIVGSVLLLFGNIGLYYYSEKSVASMLTFLFLAVHCLSTLFCIQPYTDFGVLDFLLSASLNQALSLFGIRNICSWLVLIACVVIAGLRYWLEPRPTATLVSVRV